MAAFIIVVAGMRAAADMLVPFLLSAFIALLSAPPLFWMKKKVYRDGLHCWLSFPEFFYRAF